MPKLYVKQGGAWKQVQQLYVKQGGTWKTPTSASIIANGVSKQFYPDTPGQTAYASPGTYTYTVPATVISIRVDATGAGGAGQTSYFDGGQWYQQSGAAGGATTVSRSGWSLTSNGGGGGVSSGTGGTVAISGQLTTTLNSTGGSKVNGTGGSSYYGSGSAQGGDFSKPATPAFSYGAGGGAGFQYDGPQNYGGSAGGTGIASFQVSPGQTITVNVGSGAVGANTNYTKGSNHGSYAGDGASGYVVITPLNPVYIPASGSITQYMNLSYAYGNPAVLTWTVTGTTFNFTISSSTTYCGPAFGYSGTAAITETIVGGYAVQTVTFTNNHPKVCCNGNQNYIYETYTLTMNYPNTAVLTATSSSGSQSGC